MWSSSTPPRRRTRARAWRADALCAAPDNRAELSERTTEALALERSLIAGASVKQATMHALAEELSAHLRALLSDVICGHLDPDLVALADELLMAPADGDGAHEADAEADAGGEGGAKADGDAEADADADGEADESSE